jgi:hypothetical protein
MASLNGSKTKILMKTHTQHMYVCMYVWVCVCVCNSKKYYYNSSMGCVSCRPVLWDTCLKMRGWIKQSWFQDQENVSLLSLMPRSNNIQCVTLESLFPMSNSFVYAWHLSWKVGNVSYFVKGGWNLTSNSLTPNTFKPVQNVLSEHPSVMTKISFIREH